MPELPGRRFCFELLVLNLVVFTKPLLDWILWLLIVFDIDQRTYAKQTNSTYAFGIEESDIAARLCMCLAWKVLIYQYAKNQMQFVITKFWGKPSLNIFCMLFSTPDVDLDDEDDDYDSEAGSDDSVEVLYNALLCHLL